MKKLNVLTLLLIMLASTSCQVIGDIFGAGVYTGVFLVVFVVVIIVVIITRIGRRKS